MGTLLDRLGIAVRTGHHCAQPLMQRLGIEGTVRASFGLYNTREEIDVLVAGIVRVSRMFCPKQSFATFLSFLASNMSTTKKMNYVSNNNPDY